ncbi:hypothetical protein ABVK25_010909 [Lepraria finkii]|uniref:Uncharacterized protein n=1 Tax=Lepraria finkii TaxID=1340010 RepID=A0ABR4ATE5_9LECA
MGGFVLEDSHSTLFPVIISQICYLVRNQYMEMPDITKEKVQDKSKTDGTVKIFAFQTGWVLLEIIARVAQDLPISLLELETCAIIGCSLFTFYFWFKKPILPTRADQLLWR